MKKYNYNKGRQGEDEARQFLEGKGYKLIDNNYRCSMGEIDLIMEKDGWLVFVEVKYKTDDSLGMPHEMIDKRKLIRIKKTAEWYLMDTGVDNRFEKYRIDAVCILGGVIKHYENVDN